jgi:hypothetical protein
VVPLLVATISKLQVLKGVLVQVLLVMVNNPAEFESGIMEIPELFVEFIPLTDRVVPKAELLF